MSHEKCATKPETTLLTECQSDGSHHPTHNYRAIKNIYQYRQNTDMTLRHNKNYITVKNLSKRQTHGIYIFI